MRWAEGLTLEVLHWSPHTCCCIYTPALIHGNTYGTWVLCEAWLSSSTTKFILWVDKELYALEKKSHLNGREKWELEGEGVAEYSSWGSETERQESCRSHLRVEVAQVLRGTNKNKPYRSWGQLTRRWQVEKQHLQREMEDKINLLL